MFDLDRLEPFLAAAETGGFSKAAKRLRRSQSAISQSIAALEEELGQQLFIRDGRGVRLSRAGEVLREHAALAFQQLELAQDRLSALSELRGGKLSLGTSDTLACYALPAVFAEYRSRYPAVELRIENRPSPATADEVRERRLDVGLVNLPLPEHTSDSRADRAIRVHKLSRMDDVAIVPLEHPLACRSFLRVADLGAFPLLLLDATTSSRAVVDRALKQAGVVPQIAMEMSSVEVLKRLVELSFGISVVPEISVRDDACDGKWVVLPLRGFGPARHLALVTADAPMSRAASAFIDIAKEHLR
ncbi:MAG: LysR family transcriptional regulator [Polyangiaceae bacterium]|nr:LysR family transcriptional regulator [Polyangiaceae bacterium]